MNFQNFPQESHSGKKVLFIQYYFAAIDLYTTRSGPAEHKGILGSYVVRHLYIYYLECTYFERTNFVIVKGLPSNI